MNFFIGIALILWNLAFSVEGVKTTRNIFTAGYDGFVYTIQYVAGDGWPTLTMVNRTDACKTSPSWLTIDFNSSRLFCVNEGRDTGIGSLNQFEIQDGRNLIHVHRSNITATPVHSKLYNAGKNIVVAQYGDDNTSETEAGLTFQGKTPGSDFSGDWRQMIFGPQNETHHVHGVYPDLLDRTLVALDSGGDSMRTFSYNSSGELLCRAGVKLAAGSGPRHAAFASNSETSSTFLYVLSELANTITTFNISYDSDGEMQTPVQSSVIDIFGGKAHTAFFSDDNAKAAEIQVSPDHRFAIVSNQNHSYFPYSDSLATYRINANGTLSFVQLTPSGGRFPRAFQLNKAGDLVVVAHQENSTVAVLERNILSGHIGTIIAHLYVDTVVEGIIHGLSAVVWNE